MARLLLLPSRASARACLVAVVCGCYFATESSLQLATAFSPLVAEHHNQHHDGIQSRTNQRPTTLVKAAASANHGEWNRIASAPTTRTRQHSSGHSNLILRGGATTEGIDIDSDSNIDVTIDIDSARLERRELVKDSIQVGLVSAAMGHAYGLCLNGAATALWQKLPMWTARQLQTTLSTGSTTALSPPWLLKWYIPIVTTLGGLLIGVVSSQKPIQFGVAEFVSRVPSSSNQELYSMKQLPSLLLPLLLISLLTSAFGFSLGPEAPMVAAGALVGMAMGSRGQKAGSVDKRTRQEILSYAGAAGSLTAFMGIPLAGSIFALELACSSAGFVQSKSNPKVTKYALEACVIASLAALTLIKGVFNPSSSIGGHFLYGLNGAMPSSVSGQAMLLTGAGAGIAGGILGRVFIKLVVLLKSLVWTTALPRNRNITASNTNEVELAEIKPVVAASMSKRRNITVKTLIGLIVGVIGIYFPQTLMWGEGSLQCMIDGQQTAFGATKHGLSSLLMTKAIVDPSIPFGGNIRSSLMLAFSKLVAIALACAGKFPGGIIFPLFYAAAPLAHVMATCTMTNLSCTGNSAAVVPMAVMACMAATQASVTRTPLATVLILILSASASTTNLSAMLPAIILASYVGVWTSQLLSKRTYFQYAPDEA
jgi:H+/Cl- antiporter ClcA